MVPSSCPARARTHFALFCDPFRSGPAFAAKVLLTFSYLVGPGPLAAQEWLDFIEASTKIVADESALDPVGRNDTQEKDLAVGDVDRDGDVDLVLVRKVPFSTPGGKRNALFLNEGGQLVDRTAELAPELLDETDDRDVQLADLNGDGWLDLVTATTFDEQPRIYIGQANEQGQWLGFDWDPDDNRLPTFSPAPKFCAVAVGDVDNDDDLDLFFVDYDNNLEDRLLLNNGNGFFTDVTDTHMSPETSESAFGTDARIVDINRDGARDIVKVSTLSDFPNSIRILYNAGGPQIGRFFASGLDHVYSESPYMMEVADFDGDQWPDIYAVDDSQDAYLINQRGLGTPSPVTFTTTTLSSSPSTMSFGGNTEPADLDNDGDIDLLVADVDTDFPGCIRRAVALRNEGPPFSDLTDPYAGAAQTWLPAGTFDIAVLDVNGDGNLDLWMGTCDGNRLFLSNLAFFKTDFENGSLDPWTTVQPAPL